MAKELKGIRTRVAKKASAFVKRAQQVPPPTPQAAPPGGDPTTAPPPSGGVPPAGPKPQPPAPGGAPKPPMPPQGGPAPQKSRDEIEQDVEKDIRDKKEQEKKVDELDKKVTTIGDQLEGLSKSVDTLVNMLQGESGDPTDFEKRLDEVKKEDTPGVSSGEFGLQNSDNSLVVSKEELNMANKDKTAVRRAARKARLQAKVQKKSEELDFEYGTPENKKYKQQVPPPAKGTIKKKPEDWGQYRLKASDMAMDLSASGDEWLVVNKFTDDCYYKISKAANDVKAFNTESFAKTVINDVFEMGMKAAMAKYSADPMFDDLDDDADDADNAPMPTKEKKPVPPGLQKKKRRGLPEGLKRKLDKDGPGKKDMESKKPRLDDDDDDEDVGVDDKPFSMKDKFAADEPMEAEASFDKAAFARDYSRRFNRAFRLALSAQQKNLEDNPLKAAWFKMLSELDVDSPARVIESVFAKASAPHFEAALKKAEDYMEMADESFVDLESQIGEMDTAEPADEDEMEDDVRSEHAAKLRARASRASLPLSSATSTNEFADKADRINMALPKPKLSGLSRL